MLEERAQAGRGQLLVVGVSLLVIGGETQLHLGMGEEPADQVEDRQIDRFGTPAMSL